MTLLQIIILLLLTIQFNNVFVFGQFILEILETSFGTQHLVLRCEATGANFGANVLDFSFGPKAMGCAIFAEPRNACGPVYLKPLNDSLTFCDTYFAVVARGNCSFSEKAFNVQTAKASGFDALIVYNGLDKGGPIPMSGSKHAADVNIPAIMINYACMKQMMDHFTASHGYTVTIKASPGYYDLIKYLVPFVVIVGFCFVILFISLIIRLCRERRRLSKKRLSRANLKKIPIKKYKKGEELDTCAICLEDFIENEKIRELPCRHAYHTKCIDPWLTKNRKVCPICKRKVGPSNGSDSDSEIEHNTVNNSVASTSRDSDPLLTNVYNNSNQVASGRPSILNIRWLPYVNYNNNMSVNLPSTTPLPSFPPDLSSSRENDENRIPVVQRVTGVFSRAFSSLRHKFTRTDPNVHRRLENDDTLSTIILDSDIEHQSRATRFVADNDGYAGSASGDGTSLTTVHSSHQYEVQASVEFVPNDPDGHTQ